MSNRRGCKIGSLTKLARNPLSFKTLVLALLFLQRLTTSAAIASEVEPPPATELSAPSVPVPAEYFGLHLHQPLEASWPQVPFREWRLWDSKNAVWYTLEPKKGEWNFAQLDRDVAMAEQHGVGLLLTLGQSPRWASSRPNDPPAWRPGGPAPPIDEGDWKNYVRVVASRYRGRIHEYEVWNEPNLKTFYSGTREQLLVLAKDAYQTIHEVDPSAIVVSPSVTGYYDVGWFIHYLDLGGGNFADVIGYHFYSSPKEPEASVDVIQQVLAAMHSHGIDKPLWNTESGYTITSDFSEIKPEEGSLSRILSQEEALAYVMRTYLLNWAGGVSRVYWYDWDGARMGLGDNLGRQKKPAASGYAAVEKWMVGAIMQGCNSDADHNWICTLRRNGQEEWVIWNSEASITKTLPKTWKVTQMETVTTEGNAVDVAIGNSRTVTYSTIPTLLR